MKKLISFAIGAFLLINAAIYAQPAQPQKQAFGEGRLKALLKLTPDQEKKISDLRYQHQQSVLDMHNKIQKTQLELKKNVEDGKIDEKNILQMTDEISKLQGDIKYSQVKHWLEVYKLLNDEQKGIFKNHLLRMIGPGGAKAGMMMKMNRGGKGMMQKRGMMQRRGMMQGKSMPAPGQTN